LSTEYPSWGFEVINGATTIWERWNSYIKGKGFENNAGMNSFNHYAFGSVNEWMFGNMAGIKVNQAGYRSFTIKPEIAPSAINYVRATYNSMNGEIVSSWEREGNQISLQVSVPVNTKAQLFIPAANKERVLENNRPLKSNLSLKVKGFKDGYLNLEIGSGTYFFTSEN
jgi:alpha-L-rhamnosidase